MSQSPPSPQSQSLEMTSLQGPEVGPVLAVLDPGIGGPLFWSYLFTLPIFTVVAIISNYLIFAIFNCRKFQRYRSSIFFRYVAGVDLCQALVVFGLMWLALLVPHLSSSPSSVDACCRLYTILRSTVQDLSSWGVVCMMIDRCCFATNRFSKTPTCFVVTICHRQWVIRHMHARIILTTMTLVIFSVNVAMVMGSAHQEHATSGMDCFITWRALSDFSPQSLAVTNAFLSCILPLVAIAVTYLIMRCYIPPGERTGSGMLADIPGTLRGSASHVTTLGRYLQTLLTRRHGNSSPCRNVSAGVCSRSSQTQTGRSEGGGSNSNSSLPETCPSAQLLLPNIGDPPPPPPPSVAVNVSSAAHLGNINNNYETITNTNTAICTTNAINLAATAPARESQNNNNVRPFDTNLLPARHQGVTLGPDDVILRAMVERTCRYLGNWRLDRLYSSFKRKEVILSVVAVKDPRLACLPPSNIDRNFNAMVIVHGLFFVLLIQPQLWFLVTGCLFGTEKDWCLLKHVGLAADLFSNNRINFTLFLYIVVSGNALAAPLMHSLRRLRRCCCRCIPSPDRGDHSPADADGATPSAAAGPVALTNTTTAPTIARLHEYHYPTYGLSLPLPPPSRARALPHKLQTGVRGRSQPLPLPPRACVPLTRDPPPSVTLRDVRLTIAELGQDAAGQGRGGGDGTASAC